MTSIQVYDPALCCSTGVCGLDIDQALVSFSADVDWAKQSGVKIERFNLAQQPLAFAENAKVRAFLEQFGQNGLPLILVDGRQVLAGRYPGRDELAGWIGGNADSPLKDSDSETTSSKTGACCGPSNKAAESAKSGCC